MYFSGVHTPPKHSGTVFSFCFVNFYSFSTVSFYLSGETSLCVPGNVKILSAIHVDTEEQVAHVAD